MYKPLYVLLGYVCWRVVIGNIFMSWLYVHWFFRLVELGWLHVVLAHEESVHVEGSPFQEVTDYVSNKGSVS